METIPDQVVSMIFTYLNSTDAVSFAFSCRKALAVARADVFPHLVYYANVRRVLSIAISS